MGTVGPALELAPLDAGAGGCLRDEEAVAGCFPFDVGGVGT